MYVDLKLLRRKLYLFLFFDSMDLTKDEKETVIYETLGNNH